MVAEVTVIKIGIAGPYKILTRPSPPTDGSLSQALVPPPPPPPGKPPAEEL